MCDGLNSLVSRDPQDQCSAASPLRQGQRSSQICLAGDDRQADTSKSVKSKFNPVYGAIIGAYVALLAFKTPYIYAGLSIASILPQNSNVTSLNGLVLLFYESGIFMNFAEAVDCVRLVTWLSISFMLLSFAIFN